MKVKNQQLEQTLADIAYDSLQMQQPDLFQNMIGFQLVDSDDAGTKALGMFALQLGNSYAYIPAFFMNGALKPLELLYLKDQDKFVPLTQEMLDLALRDNVSLGQSEKLPSMGLSNPDLEMYATPPRTGRTVRAAAINKKDLFDSLVKSASPTVPLTLAMSLAPSHVKLAFAKMLKDNPDYLEKICEIYPWEELKSSISYMAKQAAERGEPDFKIMDDLEEDVTPEETKRILKGKIDIRDERPGTGTTYHTDELTQYSSPDSEGFYRIPDTFGEEKIYLVMNYHSPEQNGPRGSCHGQMAPLRSSIDEKEDQEYRDIIIVDPKDGTWCIKNRQAVLAKQLSEYTYDHKALVDVLYHSLPTAKEIEMGNKYIFMKRKGYQMSMVGPLEIEELHWKKDHIYARVFCPLSHKTKKLIVSPTFSESLGVPRDGVINMSSDIKVMKVGKYEERSSSLNSLTPKGTEYNLLRKGIYKVSMATDGVEYSIRSKNKTWSSLNKTAAAKVLCLSLDMKGFDALKLMDKVDFEKKASVFVKQAVSPYYDMPMRNGPEYAPYQMSEMTDPSIQNAPYYDAQEQWFSDEYNPMQGNYPMEGFKVGIGPENMAEQPEGMGIQEAMYGADSGDQLLADAGTIVSLSSMINVDTLVESYIKDLETALDKLGRMLFLYWWKSDKLIEKYHDSDLQQTEDSLRNLFQGLGELIYKFKVKKMNISSMVESEEV